MLSHSVDVAGMTLDSPAFHAAEPSLTSQEAMLDFLVALARDSRHARVVPIGRSTQGRDIPIVYLTDEGLDDPASIRGLGRPVVWLIGQQHGSEPAGGEAMLALAAALGRGELASLLSKITVVIVPRANVDGAATQRRALASGADGNRDHLLLSQPEVRAVHAAMGALPPDVVFDHHEFSVARRWVEKFNGLQGSDVMILEATNPLISPDLSDIARNLYRPALEAAIAREGLVSFDYVTTDMTADKRVSLGGTAPGIARNAYGLRGAVSYLIETRGVGIGLENYRRRVSTHVWLARAILEVSAADPAGLLSRITRSRAATAASTADLIVSHDQGERDVDLPLIDAESGAPMSASVRMIDSRDIRPVDVRSRPAGYLVLRGMADVADRLTLNGVRCEETCESSALAVEAYTVERRETRRSRNAINPDQLVRVQVHQGTIDVPAGALFVPMTQPAAGIAAAALEPDSPGSYVGVGIIPMYSDESEAPVYRVMDTRRLSLKS